MGDKIDNLPIDSTSSSPKSDIDIILNVFKPTEGGGEENLVKLFMNLKALL